MGYNPYEDIKKITGYKSIWEQGEKEKDEKKKREAAEKALGYYNNLKSFGYEDVADKLSNSNYEQASKTLNKFKAFGLTPTREYATQKLAKYGIGEEAITYDDNTGEVRISGVSLGKPLALVDGKSYYSQATLDSAIDNAIKSTGASRTREASQNELISGAVDNYNNATDINKEGWEYTKKNADNYLNMMNSDPLDTSWGNSIMDEFNYRGGEAARGAMADSSGSNGGNVDSFAAANAQRQQLAFKTAGTRAVNEAFNTRLGHAQSLLDSMGIQTTNAVNNELNIAAGRTGTAESIQGLKESDQNIKSQQFNDKINVAETTGLYSRNEWNNPFLDIYGNVKNEGENFKKLYDQYVAEGNTQWANWAAEARNIKSNNNDEFKQFRNDGLTPYIADDSMYSQTESARQHDIDVKSAENIASGDNATKLTLADKESALTQQQINASLETARLENEKDAYAGYNVLLSMWPTTEVEKRAFIEKHIKPLYESGTAIPPESLKQLIVANSMAYNIDVDDATKICQAYGVSTDWLSGYRDRTASDGNVTWYDGSIHEGQYGGMVKK